MLYAVDDCLKIFQLLHIKKVKNGEVYYLIVTLNIDYNIIINAFASKPLISYNTSVLIYTHLFCDNNIIGCTNVNYLIQCQIDSLLLNELKNKSLTILNIANGHMHRKI